MNLAEKIRYITDENGNKQSVVLPVETYEEILEDIQDLVAVAERKTENTISIEDIKRNLKADGLL